VLDLLGVPPDPRMQGESLLPLALSAAPPPPRVVPLEYGRSYALRARHYRYIVDYAAQEHLYDLAADPAEKTDLAPAGHDALRWFRDLSGLYLVHRARWSIPRLGPLNSHRAETARSLGEP
jgi:arylsulfatase A-like enzyme